MKNINWRLLVLLPLCAACGGDEENLQVGDLCPQPVGHQRTCGEFSQGQNTLDANGMCPVGHQFVIQQQEEVRYSMAIAFGSCVDDFV